MKQKTSAGRAYTLGIESRPFFQGDPFRYHIFIPLQGTYTYVGNTPEEDLTLEPYDVLIATSIQSDYLYSLDPSPLCLTFSLDGSLLGDDGPELRVGSHKVFSKQNRSRIVAIIAALAYQDFEHVEGQRQELLDEAVAFVHTILLEDENLVSWSQQNLEVARELYALLEREYRNDANLQDMLEGFHFSRTYASHKFRQVSGRSLLEVLRLKRIFAIGNSLHQYPAKELVTLGGFRNEKVMKEALRAVLGRSYKEIVALLRKQSLIQNPTETAIFQRFLTMRKYRDQAAYPEGWTSASDRDQHFEISLDADDGPFSNTWCQIADLRMARYTQWAPMERKIGEDLIRLGYKSMRIRIFLYDADTYLIDVGNGETMRMNRRQVEEIGRYFSLRLHMILCIDFFSKSILPRNEETLQLLLEKAREMISILAENDHNLDLHSMEFSVGELSRYSKNDEEKNFVLRFLEEVSVFYTPTPLSQERWGIHVDGVRKEDVAGAARFFERVVNRGLKVPTDIAVGIYGATPDREMDKLEGIIYTYSDVVCVAREVQKRLKRYGVHLHLAQVNLSYPVPEVPLYRRNPFFSTLCLQGYFQTMNLFESISFTSTSWEDRTRDLLPHSVEGFRHMSYFTFRALGRMRGRILLRKEGVLAVADGDDLHVMVYADMERSVACYEQSEPAHYQWQNVLTFLDRPGSYEVIHETVSPKYGNFYNFKRDLRYREFILGEEWEYIDSLTRPRMRIYRMEVEKDLVLPVDVHAFDVHIFHIKKEPYRP